MRYKHDCQHCKFLSEFRLDNRVYNLYFCSQVDHPTVVARFGNEPHEYTSGLGYQHGPLQYAERLARAEGYFDVETPLKWMRLGEVPDHCWFEYEGRFFMRVIRVPFTQTIVVLCEGESGFDPGDYILDEFDVVRLVPEHNVLVNIRIDCNKVTAPGVPVPVLE